MFIVMHDPRPDLGATGIDMANLYLAYGAPAVVAGLLLCIPQRWVVGVSLDGS
jgi:hypothetical protein